MEYIGVCDCRNDDRIRLLSHRVDIKDSVRNKLVCFEFRSLLLFQIYFFYVLRVLSYSILCSPCSDSERYIIMDVLDKY